MVAMVKVTMQLTVWTMNSTAFKRYNKEVELLISPMPGLIIDDETIDYVSMNSTTGDIKCVMENIDMSGYDYIFDSVCNDLVAEGWKRV